MAWKCINPTCTDGIELYARSACKRCYNAAATLVRQGKTTFAELEELGGVGPKRRARPRPASSWFDQLLADKAAAARKARNGD